MSHKGLKVLVFLRKVPVLVIPAGGFSFTDEVLLPRSMNLREGLNDQFHEGLEETSGVGTSPSLG